MTMISASRPAAMIKNSWVSGMKMILMGAWPSPGRPAQVDGAGRRPLCANPARHDPVERELGRLAALADQQAPGELAPAEAGVVAEQVRLAHQQGERDGRL